MTDQVLIVASKPAARAPAEVITSLLFTPVVASTEKQALDLLERKNFRLIVVSGTRPFQRLCHAAERKQPATRVLRLPEGNGDRVALRSLIAHSLEPRANRTADERDRSLSTILESFTSTLDFREVMRRIVSVTRDEFAADRAWLLYPVGEGSESARVRYSAGVPEEANDSAPLSLARSRNLIRKAMASSRPIVVKEGDRDLDPQLAKRYQVRSEIVQILRPSEDEPWAFGIHASSMVRDWTEDEVSLFGEIGRYATLALNNALLHQRVVRDITKVNAILDQIPEGALIYDANGRLERMNAAAARDPAVVVGAAPDERMQVGKPRSLDGRQLTVDDLPSMRALRGEKVKTDYVDHSRGGDERIMNVRAAPIYDQRSRIIGSVVLSRDVTEERQNAEREGSRRRRAECLANLGLEALTMQTSFDDLSEPARRVADAIQGTVRINLYRSATGSLELVGYAGTKETAKFHDYFAAHPYRPGEGLAGTVFQIGRPLLFYEIRGNAVLDFARDDEERQIKAEIHEQSLIAFPIESYGERIGALVMSQSDPRQNFDAEDLEFARTVAERIGAASHIHDLTRISQEGHRAAEELARREVDARVRFEAVLETAPIGVAVISADEIRFEMANARWLEFASHFGKIAPDTRVIGLRVAEVIPGWEQTLKQVAETGELQYDEGYLISARPSPIYVNRIISPVRGRFSGITQSLTVLVQDVTDQVKAKREIEGLAQMMAERSARLDSILGSMTDGLWVYDASGELVDVNQAALTMFGLGSRTEAASNASFENFQLRYPDGRSIPRKDLPYARALRGMTVPDYLAVGKHLISGKDLDLSIAAAPIESDGIVGAVLVIRDITALQELDRKKDEFLSVASHELRTPLTTIKGYTQLLSQSIDDLASADRANYLNAVLSEIERMMGLITELLDVSRIETNRLQIDPQPVRWLEFVERRASAFRVQNPARTILFSAEIPETTMHVDPDRMRQVIDNLLSNAIKYSPEPTDIEVRAAVADGHMLTSVIDHGIGIPSDEIPKLFERFHRARNVSSRYYGGLGLGLYIARAIVEAHKGFIAVRSEEGQGAMFTIRLPMR